MSPSISIIIPVYNVGPYVEDCLRSVMRQTYTGPMECIIVDDCGTDNSMEIVERLVSEYDGPIDFKVLHHTHNRGVSAARNTGMDAAIGDYLLFVDSDDMLTEDCLEVLTKPLETEWYGVIDGRNSDIKENAALEEIDSEMVLLRPPHIVQNFIKLWGVPMWNRLYNSSFIRKNNLSFIEGLIHEDILWSFQIACVASSLLIINQITYVYRQREGSFSTLEIQEKRGAAFITILKEMNKCVKMHHIKDCDVFRVFSFYFYIATHFFSSSPSAYATAYKSMRPLFHASFKSIIQKNHFRIKAYIHDLHYFLPLCIAPYWQYLIYYRLRPQFISA